MGQRISSEESLRAIKIGDIHYEFEYGTGVKVEVITAPIEEDGSWSWQSKNVNTGAIIDYTVSPKYAHYGPKLYDYEAYIGCKYI